MADVGLPLAAIRDQMADAVDLVVRQERGADGVRRIVEVAQVVRVAGGPAVRELFTIRGGRASWRAPLDGTPAGRLAAAAGEPPRAGAGAPGAPGDFDPGTGDQGARRRCEAPPEDPTAGAAAAGPGFLPPSADR
jgi:pilus assembly protein CpaF